MPVQGHLYAFGPDFTELQRGIEIQLVMNANSSRERAHIEPFNDHLAHTCALASPKQTSQTGS